MYYIVCFYHNIYYFVCKGLSPFLYVKNPTFLGGYFPHFVLVRFKSIKQIISYIK